MAAQARPLTPATGARCARGDGHSERPSRDCIGDTYEYFGPGCRLTWDYCLPPTSGAAEPLPEKWVVDCRKEGTSIVCDCLDNDRLVNTVSAPADVCPTRPPGPMDTPGPEVFEKFLPLSKTCLFCAEPS
jgi:hypothetical protein